MRARLLAGIQGIEEEAQARFGATPAYGQAVDAHGFLALHCSRDKAADLAAWLVVKGAGRVSVSAVEQIFDAANPLYEALERRLAKI